MEGVGPLPLMPAKAGIQHFAQNWVPACGDERSDCYFFNTLTALPASHCLMSSTICV